MILLEKSKLKILILEDSQERIKVFRERYKDHDLNIFTFYEEAKEFLFKNSPIDLVLLDHDLLEDKRNFCYGPNNEFYEYTGFNLVKDILKLEIEKRPFNIIIHSRNEPAAERMHLYLKDRKIDSALIPFSI